MRKFSEASSLIASGSRCTVLSLHIYGMSVALLLPVHAPWVQLSIRCKWMLGHTFELDIPDRHLTMAGTWLLPLLVFLLFPSIA